MAVPATCDAFSTDDAYFKALTEGDDDEIEKAWICLYSTHLEYKEKVLFRLGLNRLDEENIKDAEDAYTESIIAVIHCIRQGKFIPGKSKISTYLFACCKYRVLKIKHNRSRFVNETFSPARKKEMEEEINEMVVRELEKEYREKVAVIKKAVSELRKGCADILLRFLYAGEDAARIAEALNIGVHSVRTDIARCRNKLLELLISKYKFPPDGLWV